MEVPSLEAAELAAGREPSPRFLQTGLLRLSRHPNFFFENAQWWMLFAFGAVAAGSVLQWTVLGVVLLAAAVHRIDDFTEAITKSKYPEYADYPGDHLGGHPVVPSACARSPR